LRILRKLFKFSNNIIINHIDFIPGWLAGCLPGLLPDYAAVVRQEQEEQQQKVKTKKPEVKLVRIRSPAHPLKVCAGH
jgi:hypothetical protein